MTEPDISVATNEGTDHTPATNTKIPVIPVQALKAAVAAKPEDVVAEAPPMSRRALKRQRKQEEWDAKAEERKRFRKEKKVQKKEERKKLQEQGVFKYEGKKRIKPEDQIPSPLRIIVDGDFDQFMSEKEIISTAQQIGRCYSANRAALRPVNLVVASMGPKIKKALTDHQEAWERWKGITFEEGKTFDAVVENKDDVIYLSADSTNVLMELDETKAYVIGGIVDRNRHKGLCFSKAAEAGVKTACLPISEYINLSTRKVLTINHVFEIMSKYLEHKDWKTAFLEVIPPRKGANEKGAEDEGEGGENGENGEEEDQ
ncbi:tRNA (guanine(9)-N(1))-methyltransferase [Dinochytrium kinnereticum]|nr:tRNA (guanine(9)-N(1))-methyltransferase [Dinochytrium kinnereticum]